MSNKYYNNPIITDNMIYNSNSTISNDIAILTFHNADNYGAVLQNYALQMAIKQIGYNPVTIDYRSKKIEDLYRIRIVGKGKNLLYILKDTIVNIVNYSSAVKRKEAFDSFRKLYINLTSKVTYKEISYFIKNHSYSTYICGSDQIWNCSIIDKEDVQVYTLSFVPNSCKKVSYAASAGSSKLMSQNMLKYVFELNQITVREAELKDFIDKYSMLNHIDKEIYIVCDPVLLLQKNQWLQLISTNPISCNNDKASEKSDSYLYLYYMSRFQDAKNIALDVANEKGLSIRYPLIKRKKTLEFQKCVYEHGPIEFLSDIVGADFLVVASFHGVAFSVIFEKEFIAVLPEKTGSRVFDLLKELDLSDRIVDSYEDYKRKKQIMQVIDWNHVKAKLDTLRNSSIDILNKLCKN